MLQAQLFTLYPEVFPGLLNKGLYGKALAKNLWSLNVINIRDAAKDKHKTVDDTPYGGGSGMLLKPDVLANSIDQNVRNGERIFYLSPKGKKFDQKLAQDLSKEKSFSLICGHFEGVDERILSTRNIEEISIGDYVLSGGSRKKRIANGSGTDPATINKLLKQFKMMSEMMKKMSKGNLKGMADKGIPPELFNQIK